MTCFRWGLQNKVESFIQGTEKRIFTNFHREARPISLISAKCVPSLSNEFGSLCSSFRCSVGWTSGMGWPWPTSGRWRRRPRPSWTKKEIRCEDIINLGCLTNLTFEYFRVKSRALQHWRSKRGSQPPEGTSNNFHHCDFTLFDEKANKGTVTFCLRIEQSSSATCRNHSWAQSNWGLCWGVGFVMFWIQLLWYL